MKTTVSSPIEVARRASCGITALGLFSLLLLVLPGASMGAIYRCVEPDGMLTFSDQPCEGAKEVTIQPMQTFSRPPAATSGDNAAEGEAGSGYQRFAIVEPSEDATIRDNAGNVTVFLSLDPALAVQQGHKIKVSLNGTLVTDKLTAQGLTMREIDRGTHTVQAEVIDAEGNSIISATPVTFHLKRASILAPKR